MARPQTSSSACGFDWCQLLTIALFVLAQLAVTSHASREGRQRETPSVPQSYRQRTAEPRVKERDGDTQPVIRERDRELKERNSAVEDNVCEMEITCKQDDGQMSHLSRVPIQGARGPPGQPGEPGRQGEEGLQGLPGLPGQSALTPKRVAFFVGLSDNLGPVKEQTIVTFDRVVTNIGESYDATSGRFTAPINGTYQFNVVISAQGRQKAAVMLVKNSHMVATVWAESIPNWATSSNVAVLSLDRDDQVWLVLLNRASFLHGYMYTTMSGFLIFEN